MILSILICFFFNLLFLLLFSLCKIIVHYQMGNEIRNHSDTKFLCLFRVNCNEFKFYYLRTQLWPLRVQAILKV